MEIDIPDLQDLTFTERCRSCQGKKEIPVDPTTLGEHVRYKRGEPRPMRACPYCDGKGELLTPVGERLLAFLKSVGIPIPEPEGWHRAV